MRGLIAALTALVVVLPASGWAADDAENYCHSKETNQRWEDLAEKNHDSNAIQRLNALRIGLCAQVERGILTVARATTIFERQREKVIQRIKRQEGSGPKGV